MTAHGADAERWRSFLDRLPPERRDVHQLPEYAAIYEAAYPEKMAARAAVMENEAGTVIYPFMLRTVEIGGEQAYIDGRPALDIAIPYGIGGPLWLGPEQAASGFYNRFDAAFLAWAGGMGIASEFLCPHMLTGSLDLILGNPGYHCEPVKSVVTVDLRGDPAMLKAQLRKGHKADVARAVKSGVRVTRAIPDEQTYAACAKLYYATMDRHQAAERWYFPERYFRSCLDHLGPEKSAFFLTRTAEGELGAWSIVMGMGDTLYYHFAASDPTHAAVKPSTLMVHEICLWAQQNGYSRLYMGGGATLAPDDGIFRFKSGFSRHTLMVHNAWRIVNKPAYDMLSGLWTEQAARCWSYAGGNAYFPFYRCELRG